jgi:hypothetical protein
MMQVPGPTRRTRIHVSNNSNDFTVVTLASVVLVDDLHALRLNVQIKKI